MENQIGNPQCPNEYTNRTQTFKINTNNNNNRWKNIKIGIKREKNMKACNYY